VGIGFEPRHFDEPLGCGAGVLVLLGATVGALAVMEGAGVSAEGGAEGTALVGVEALGARPLGCDVPVFAFAFVVVVVVVGRCVTRRAIARPATARASVPTATQSPFWCGDGGGGIVGANATAASVVGSCAPRYEG
jgi:hypothetical protein